MPSEPRDDDERIIIKSFRLKLRKYFAWILALEIKCSKTVTKIQTDTRDCTSQVFNETLMEMCLFKKQIHGQTVSNFAPVRFENKLILISRNAPRFSYIHARRFSPRMFAYHSQTPDVFGGGEKYSSTRTAAPRGTKVIRKQYDVYDAFVFSSI